MQNKVAIFLNRYAETEFFSGGEKVDFYLIKALYEFGFDIDIYCSETDVKKSKLANNIYVDGCSIYKDKVNEYLFCLGENFENHKTFLYIHENSRHFQDKYTRNNFVRLIQNIAVPKRVKKIKERLDFEKQAVDTTKFFIVPSTIVANDLKEFFNVKDEQIFILPPPVVMSEKLPQREKNKIFTFGLSARGFGNKGGWQTILSAFLLKLCGKKFKLLIIYPFTYTDWTVKLIIFLLGLMNNVKIIDYFQNMNDFYKQIDCLVVSSKREAFGLVAPEAMMQNIPVILSTRCGATDFVKDGINGFVYDYKKPLFNLFKKMLFVINNKNLLCEVQKNGLEIEKDLSYEQFKIRFERILRTLKYM